MAVVGRVGRACRSRFSCRYGRAATSRERRVTPRVIGLDLSITATGLCDPDGATVTIGGKSGMGDARLTVIAGAVAGRVRHADRGSLADLVVIEDLPVHAHGAGITAMVHGAVRLVLLRSGVPYVTVPAATLKKYATGKGNADKTAMAIAALKRADLEFGDDNQCDAWWLRAAGLEALGCPVVAIPKQQTECLSKVAWPNLKEKQI